MARLPDKPRILLVTRNFPPLTGGMERLMLQTALGVSDYAKLTIAGPKGCSAYCPPNVRAYESPTRLGAFLLMSTWYALRASCKSQFTVFIGGSGLIAPTLLLLRKLFGGKTLIFLHGLDLIVDNFIYQRVFIPCIRSADHIIVNSQKTLEIAIEKGVPVHRITVINPGTHLPELTKIESQSDFLKRNGIPFKKVMIFVGRITKRKGLSGFTRHSLPAIFDLEPEAGLIVVGDNANQSLTKLGEAEEVIELVSRLKIGAKVMFLGKLDDKDLDSCYSAADVQIFPLIDCPGDVEGFGMVAIEAAACGTPTVAFSTGGVADAISSENGILVEPGRYDLFTEAVTRTLREGRPGKEQCLDHAKKFGWDRYNKNVKAVISLLAQPS